MLGPHGPTFWVRIRSQDPTSEIRTQMLGPDPDRPSRTHPDTTSGSGSRARIWTQPQHLDLYDPVSRSETRPNIHTTQHLGLDPAGSVWPNIWVRIRTAVFQLVTPALELYWKGIFVSEWFHGGMLICLVLINSGHLTLRHFQQTTSNLNVLKIKQGKKTFLNRFYLNMYF